jgi:hypothetical protein
METFFLLTQRHTKIYKHIVQIPDMMNTSTIQGCHLAELTVVLAAVCTNKGSHCCIALAAICTNEGVYIESQRCAHGLSCPVIVYSSLLHVLTVKCVRLISETCRHMSVWRACLFQQVNLKARQYCSVPKSSITTHINLWCCSH